MAEIKKSPVNVRMKTHEELVKEFGENYSTKGFPIKFSKTIITKHGGKIVKDKLSSTAMMYITEKRKDEIMCLPNISLALLPSGIFTLTLKTGKKDKPKCDWSKF